MADRVARLKYSHSDPLFRFSGLRPVSVSNRESIEVLLRGEVDVSFVPVTYASRNREELVVIPEFAIYSDGPVLSARLFRGSGSGYAAVSDTSVNAMALRKLMGIEFDFVDDPVAALGRYGGVLVIGDEALRLVDADTPYIVDVGELWKLRVGHPLVYAVMVARRNVDPAFIERVVRALNESLDRFRGSPGELAREVARRINVSERLMLEYYSAMRYQVDGRVMAGIEEELRIFGLPQLQAY
ncbi:MqnA/MqnD/SBP family protein [Conexivisphaera calida]|uniref:Chorismate dehydratase n=1 Tax=Conexivisphaera calida TaxID=1874277 RepID=A0A4P2VCQ3_9ARCH|nr:MqnA/MqnD/SBP family protein [Conexivisphaera calida]BBE41911.1 Menaquinone via futalosine step 1 [Conexivisphaera calida]